MNDFMKEYQRWLENADPETVKELKALEGNEEEIAYRFKSGLSFGTADLLNALAGILYGVNIALTGVFAKKYHAPLYVMIQLFVQAITSFVIAIAFNFITFGAEPMDKIVFTPDPLLIIALIGIGILTNSVCWTIRTSAMKYVSANVVAVIMPFSAVITGTVSVILGMDSLSYTLIIGAILGLAASFISSASDIMENSKAEKESAEIKENS